MVDFISSTELACQGQRSLAKRLFYQRNENGQARLEGVYEARSQATESVFTKGMRMDRHVWKGCMKPEAKQQSLFLPKE